jgi:Skp family chaperone for outer membrane proteins
LLPNAQCGLRFYGGGYFTDKINQKHKLNLEKAMKSRNFIIAFLAGILVCVCVFNQSGIARPAKEISAAKIAVVNVERLLIDGEKNKRFEANYKQDTARIKIEVDKLQEEIDDSRDSLMKHVKRDSPEFTKRGLELMEKEMMLETRKKYIKQELSLRRQRWLEDSFRLIIKEIDKVAKAEGYDMVMAKEGYHWPSASSNELMLVIQTSKVLYNSDEMDITDKVLESWNAAKLD